MQFDQWARVFSIDRRPIGWLDRVVINPNTKEITQVVIRSKVLITRERVVPLELVDTDEQDCLMLRLDARQLAGMPDFGTIYYRVVSEEELNGDEVCTSLLSEPACFCPPYPAASVNPSITHPQMKGTRLNIPAGMVALKIGAKVVSADGKHLGHVERVLTSPPSNRVGYLQISKGRRSQKRTLLPIEWVDHLEEEQVLLAVGARLIKELPE